MAAEAGVEAPIVATPRASAVSETATAFVIEARMSNLHLSFGKTFRPPPGPLCRMRIGLIAPNAFKQKRFSRSKEDSSGLT
jgi:hypothetical protein